MFLIILFELPFEPITQVSYSFSLAFFFTSKKKLSTRSHKSIIILFTHTRKHNSCFVYLFYNYGYCLFVLMLMLWLNRIIIVYRSTLRCRLDQNFFEDKKKYSNCKELFDVFIKHGLDGQFWNLLVWLIVWLGFKIKTCGSCLNMT